MNKDFQRTFKTIASEYGEDFELLNGFHESQLNFSDFVEAFVDKNVADVTIDANANASNKDIRSLMSEKGKSNDKLIAFNKIFYELKKKYGLKVAKEWLETEYNGGFYLHDASTTTYFAYCVLPQETCYYAYQGKILHGNFNDIYNILPEKEVYLPEIDAYAKYPQGLQVQDKKGWTCVKRICWHKNTDKEMRFIKTKNGQSIITTEDHTIFNINGEEFQAKDINKNETLDIVFSKDLFTNSITRWNGKELNYDLGWLVGFIAAEGTIPKKGSMISISQSVKSSSDIKQFLSICDKYKIKYHIYDYQEGVIRINICAGSQQNSNPEKYNWRQFIASIIKGNYSYEKHLTPEYVNFKNDFLLGFVSGLFDGDGTIIKDSTFSLRLSSRTLLNQVQAILLTNNIVVSNGKPYIQKYQKDEKIKQTRPVYGIQVNMNSYPDFFTKLINRKVSEKWVNKTYDAKMANKTFSQDLNDSQVILNDKTFDQDIVYDLTTETGSFICNNIRIHNCYAYDLTRLATEGLFFLKNYNSKPPKHLTTFIDDVIEYISYMSNRSSGAVGIPNILIWTYYFWKKDCESNYLIKDKDYYIRQCFQKLIYRLNQPFIRIDQSAFVNISIFDRNYIESLFGGVEYPDGTYVIDYMDELIEHQKVFMEVVSDVRKENMFTFPVLTYSLLYQNNEFVDKEFARWCSDHNTIWNDSNFFTSDNVSTLSNCCRLLSDTSKLDAFINSIGGTALSIGSVKVNTINLMRIALETNDEKKYLNLLKKRTQLCCKTLDVIRHIIKRNIEKGLLPNYQEGAMELSKQYCTVGILGLYEVIEHFGYIQIDEFGYKSYTDKGIEFACKIFDTINDVKDNFTNEYSFNVESVPAERAAVILCQKDNVIYDKNDKFIYSNQWIPLSEKCTITEKIKLSSILDKKCSGGAITHINIENNFPNKDVAWDMLNYIAQNGVIYFAFNSKINECKNHHGFVGTNICPECGEGVSDTYQRIIGYLAPTRSYSKDRFKEFNTRKWYEYSEIVKDL